MQRFALQVARSLESGAYADALAEALHSIAELDADSDGVANIDEILLGTAPGDGSDVWPYCSPSPALSGQDDKILDSGTNASLPEGYDVVRAYRRVHILYCGQSPSYDQLREFEASASASEQRYQALHDALDGCLDSAYWRDEGLHRIADSLIRPVSAFGPDSPTGVVFGDYHWDYQLFSYVMTGHRDVRDLLRADYHVRRRDDGGLEPITGVIPSDIVSPLPIGAPDGGGQPLEVQHRAGMITTQWFVTANTMFSELPRNTAAQAYRAYLGYDIAQLQGIWPVANEPRDIDNKGVARAECATCHSTLDPLSYAFAYYEGFPEPFRSGAQGTYNPERPVAFLPQWQNDQSWLLGQPVDSVVAWAERAAQTDEFKRRIGLLLFRHALDREPTPGERAAFDAVWRALPEDGWSANRLLHRLIDLPGFGGRS